MPISPTLPADGESNWDVSLNAALTEIIDEVNAQETDIAAALTTAAAPELIRDTMGTALVAGSNVTITVNDGSDTITIASSGGGGSTNLDGLTDVTIASPTANQYLRYDSPSTTWVNSDISTSHITSGTMATARLGSGTANNTKYLRGDQTWATIPAEPDASDTVKGLVELATNAETTTGTDTVRATTPAGVKAVADTKAALVHTHAASDITSGTIATVRLGSGTADSTTFLRGDGTWAAGGGGGATNLDGLSDVTIATPANRHVLRYESASSQWKNEANSIPVSEINATGTASSSTYLRGDGTWSTPSGGGGGSRTSRIRWLPPMTTSATDPGGSATKGVVTYCINNCTATSISMKANTTSGRTYRFRIYEMNSTATQMVALVGSAVDVASPGTVTGATVTATVSLDLTMGTLYTVCVTDTSSDTAVNGIYYNVNSYGQWPASLHLGTADGMKGAVALAKVTPGTGDTWTVANAAFVISVDTIDR